MIVPGRSDGLSRFEVGVGMEDDGTTHQGCAASSGLHGGAGAAERDACRIVPWLREQA